MEKYHQIRVAVADDSSLTRYSLNKLLTSSGEFIISIEASNGQELIDQFSTSFPLPDICILDIGMPIMDGYRTLAELGRRWPIIKTLMLSVHSAAYSVVHTIGLGARGYLPKDGAMGKLREALMEIYNEGYYYSDVAPKAMYDTYAGGKNKYPSVSEREREVLGLTLLGYTNKEIADKIGITKRTVESYRDSLCHKMQVSTKAELIMFAIKNELVMNHGGTPNS